MIYAITYKNKAKIKVFKSRNHSIRFIISWTWTNEIPKCISYKIDNSLFAYGDLIDSTDEEDSMCGRIIQTHNVYFEKFKKRRVLTLHPEWLILEHDELYKKDYLKNFKL